MLLANENIRIAKIDRAVTQRQFQGAIRTFGIDAFEPALAGVIDPLLAGDQLGREQVPAVELKAGQCVAAIHTYLKVLALDGHRTHCAGTFKALGQGLAGLLDAPCNDQSLIGDIAFRSRLVPDLVLGIGITVLRTGAKVDESALTVDGRMGDAGGQCPAGVAFIVRIVSPKGPPAALQSLPPLITPRPSLSG